MLNGAAISWRSKRQSTIALSTAEEKFISASAMVQEVIYLRKFLGNLGFSQTAPTPVFADNEPCHGASLGLKALSVGASVPSMSICAYILCTRLAQLVIYSSTRQTAN